MRRFQVTMCFFLLSAVPAYAQVNPQQVIAKTLHEDDYKSQQSLFRHTTLQQAWSAAQANQRPILLYVTSDNCLYCKKMLRLTLAHPQISQVIAVHTESYAFNATESPALAQRLGVRGYPATLIISPKHGLLHQIDGFVEPQEFAKRVWPVLQEFESSQYATKSSR